MKIQNGGRKQWVGFVGVGAIACISAMIAFSQSVPQPGITIALTNTNQLNITVTNGVSFANYELYRRTLLDSLYPWTLHMIGGLGQTNFSTNTGIQTIGFFSVTVGLDWDQDGRPNATDPQPSNAGVSNLVITIDSPTSGTVFN
jgi:hypothetical protein